MQDTLLMQCFQTIELLYIYTTIRLRSSMKLTNQIG